MIQGDFTRQKPEAIYDVVLTNPPYVRHHHLAAEEKQRLRELAQNATGLRLSGLAGLYCYFLLIAHAWLAENGLAAWLIPSEFMDVNYGRRGETILDGAGLPAPDTSVLPIRRAIRRRLGVLRHCHFREIASQRRITL